MPGSVPGSASVAGLTGLRAVCFDAAGTLFRVRGSVGAIYAEQALAHGLAARDGLAVELERRFHAQFPLMPRPRYRLGEQTYNETVDRQWWRLLVSRVFEGLGSLDFEPFFDAVFDRFGESGCWVVFPEVLPVLTRLRKAGLKLAIVSNFDARLLPVCRGLGLATAVDAIVFAAQVGVAKPDRGIFRAALDRLGVAPEATLHVGDSWNEDVVGARAAALHAFHLDRDRPAAVGASGVVSGTGEIIEDLSILPRLMGR